MSTTEVNYLPRTTINTKRFATDQTTKPRRGRPVTAWALVEGGGTGLRVHKADRGGIIIEGGDPATLEVRAAKAARKRSQRAAPVRAVPFTAAFYQA